MKKCLIPIVGCGYLVDSIFLEDFDVGILPEAIPTRFKQGTVRKLLSAPTLTHPLWVLDVGFHSHETVSEAGSNRS